MKVKEILIDWSEKDWRETGISCRRRIWCLIRVFKRALLAVCFRRLGTPYSEVFLGVDYNTTFTSRFTTTPSWVHTSKGPCLCVNTVPIRCFWGVRVRSKWLPNHCLFFVLRIPLYRINVTSRSYQHMFNVVSLCQKVVIICKRRRRMNRYYHTHERSGACGCILSLI